MNTTTATMLATPLPPPFSPSNWEQLCIDDVKKHDSKLLSTIRVKNETLRDVYNQSTSYYEKRQGRNKSTLVASGMPRNNQLGPLNRAA
jgi:hypothetical protein